jgi:hypothetical protein
MHFLVGAAVFLVLLYFWLLGHWFARVVVFLILATPCIGLMMFGSPEGIQIGLVFGLATWPIAEPANLLLQAEGEGVLPPFGRQDEPDA